MVGEIAAWESAVFIKFFESTVFENVTTIPDSAALAVPTPDLDVLRPLHVSEIVILKVLQLNTGEEMIIDPA